ncbi:MAG: glycerophosphodiester phosphodiesterase [Propionibacteriaceae bacterium]|nr:glycerophosphodiester phosphodiesterase [Propionibacteriaceae bacterium]
MIAADYPYLRTGFIAMAHRGGSTYMPNLGKENTLHAFQQAIALGYRYIETDVQATKDHRLVVFHDRSMERLASVAGPVRNHTSAEVSTMRVGGEPIPFFDEVVEALPDIRFNIDLKTADAVEPLVAAIRAHKLADRVLVVSFSQTRISHFRARTRGRIPTAMAPLGALWTTLIPGARRIIASPGVAVQVPRLNRIGSLRFPVLTPDSIRRAHQLGRVVHAWTVNDPKEMDKLVAWGVDGIITDRPDLLKDVLISHNKWEGS